MNLFLAFSEDLCNGWALQGADVALAPGAPPGVPNLYRRSNCGAEGYELLSTKAPPNFGFELSSEYIPLLRGFSADGTRSVFTADDALTANATPKKGLFQVYEAYDGGKLRLISVLPNGSATRGASAVGFTEEKHRIARSASAYHAVSADGSRVFWTDTGKETVKGGDFGEGPGKLYLRLNATEPSSLISAGKCTQPARACTIAVSEDPTSRFWSATPAGSKAIYTTGSFGGGGQPGEATLHLFDLAKGQSEAIATALKGFMGASEDLSRVYFASSDVLTGAAENSEGDVAQAGKANLYLYQQGAGLSFIATLSSRETLSGENPSTPNSPIAPLPYKRTARVSAEGRYAVFTSAAPLTGYDNADTSSGQPDAEVYRYDASTEKLVCLSCNPSGARPHGREAAGVGNKSANVWDAAQIPGWQSSTYARRPLSADASRLFFDSFDALVPADTNGKKDVYQWEAPGSGDCTKESRSYFESNGGCISLISSGQSPNDSEFFDATPSGSEVFFATSSSLLPQDPGLVDVYAASENGGFPPPPPPPPPCVGDACQSVPSPPNDPTPASAGFKGAGDPRPSKKGRCPKGKRRVTQRGKASCVSRKHKKQQTQKKQQRAKRHHGRAAR